MQNAIRAIKVACPEMIVMPDVALDPYSIYGHDGIIAKGDIENDLTNAALKKMAVSHAEPVPILLPSDMMDGRVVRLREAWMPRVFTRSGSVILPSTLPHLRTLP
jgi:porphobilinogen synthase